MAGKKKSPIKRRGRGRPPVANKKVSYHLMLDPRYLEYLGNWAEQKSIPLPILMRIALETFLPNPFGSAVSEIRAMENLAKERASKLIS